MTAKTQRGIIVLADLAGFTRFLSETELEHAHDVLSEILHLVIERLTPTLSVAEVEGDAVFAYAPYDRFPRGETLLELIEQTYGLFLGRIESIRLHTTCSCSACSAVPILDLKFIVHLGDYILQDVGTGRKPLGSAVNLAHRLLKNHVEQATGWKAYALFTEDAVGGLALPTQGMHQQIEEYENFPPVLTYAANLRQRWQDLRDAQRIRVGPERADVAHVMDLPASPPVVWDWLNDPRLRSRWYGLENKRASSPDQRSGIGTTTHCTHGEKLESVHTILDWHPFDYFTEQISRPSDGLNLVLNTVELEPTPTGTRLHDRYQVLLQPRLLTVPFFRIQASRSQRAALFHLKRLLSPPSNAATDVPPAPSTAS